MGSPSFSINNRRIGPDSQTYIIAEMSANHNKSFEKAVKIIKAAQNAGADAVKLQTYTPDTITVDARNQHFKVKGTIWEGKNLYDLYKEAYTPWDWQPELKQVANELGLDFFSTPFDPTAVGFLEKLEVPAYKIASFELVDIPLIKKIALTGKPIIMSTGMGSLDEIKEAVQAALSEGNTQIALLKCVSAYPAPYEEMNLKTIPDMSEIFKLPVGLSDHTLGIEVAVAAVALGACIIEKHLILSRSDLGPDSTFSLEPKEFKRMVKAIRNTEMAIGDVCYQITEQQKISRNFRRSLFVVEDIEKGDIFTNQNIKSIRPAYGLHPRHLPEVIGSFARSAIVRGTPLKWEMIKKTP